MAKKIRWMQAAEIMGVTDRTMRHWKRRHEKHGCLPDRRYGPTVRRKKLWRRLVGLDSLPSTSS
jgi:transposase